LARYITNPNDSASTHRTPYNQISHPWLRTPGINVSNLAATKTVNRFLNLFTNGIRKEENLVELESHATMSTIDTRDERKEILKQTQNLITNIIHELSWS